MATIVSSFNITSGSVDTRAADGLTFTFTARPQAMSIYLKFQERGTIHIPTAFLVWIGTTTLTAPYLGIAHNASNLYRASYHNGIALVTSTLAAGPVVGQIVELLLTLSAAGVVQLSQSINGAAVTSATASSAGLIPATWSAQRISFNGIAAGIQDGATALMNCEIIRGVQDMPTMRRLAGTQNR